MSRAVTLAPLLLVLAGCGRIGFDALDAAIGDDGDAGVPIDAGDAAIRDAGADVQSDDGGTRSVTLPEEVTIVGDCSIVELRLTGTGLVDGIDVSLRDSAGVTIRAIDVTTTTDIRARFVVIGAAAGPASVVVTWPAGDVITLSGAVTIPETAYTGALFVDGDASDATPDGTRAAPYPTIEGGRAAAHGRALAVIVDASAAPYAPFVLGSGDRVIGCAWSGASARPRVAFTGRHVLASDVDAVLIEGIDLDVTLGGAVEGLVVSLGSDIVLRDVGLSGTATGADARLLVLEGSERVEIADSWIHAVHHVGTTGGDRTMRAIEVSGVRGFHLHHSEISDVGFVTEVAATNTGLFPVSVHMSASSTASRDVRIHHVLVHDVFMRCDGNNQLFVFEMSNVNYPDWAGVFALHNLTIADIRHADTPSATTVTAGHVAGAYIGLSGGTRTWRDNLVAHLAETDEAMSLGSSSYYGFWVDGLLSPAPSPQPMDHSAVSDVGTPLPSGANPTGWGSGFVNQVSAGFASIQNADALDPLLDRTPGPTYYHPTASRVATGASDGGEMGAFGGGAWTPPSQRAP